MPNRVIKESLLCSEKVASLSDFEFRLWTSLILLADDAGRGDARSAIIKGRAFPLRERVSLKDIESALHALAAKGCISLYDVGGKSYFLFPSWGRHQRIRNCVTKYPEPPEEIQSAAICGELPQVAASCGELRPESEVESEYNSNPNPKGARTAPATQEDYGFGPELQAAFADWLAYKAEKREGYKPTGLRNLVSEVRNNAKKHGEKAVSDLIRSCIASGYKGIIFDRLEEKKGGYGQKPAQCVQRHGEALTDFERDAIAKLMEEEA